MSNDDMLKRKTYAQLANWKRVSNGRTAAFVEGARRIGKSTVVEEFARFEYADYLLLDFAQRKRRCRAALHRERGRFRRAVPKSFFLLEEKTLPKGEFEGQFALSALSLVVHEGVDLRLARCTACGRLVRVKRQGDKSRRDTCSDACGKRKSRGNIDSRAGELRKAYLGYMESGKELRIGVDEAPEKNLEGVEVLAPVKKRYFDRIKMAIFGYRRWL